MSNDKKQLGAGTALYMRRRFERERDLTRSYRHKACSKSYGHGDHEIDVDECVKSLRKAAAIFENMADDLEDDQ